MKTSRHLKNRLQTLLAVVVLSCLAAPAAKAAENPAAAPAKKEDVDSVLDRLERRLIDQDKDVLNFGDEKDEPVEVKKSPTKYTYSKSKITSSTAEQDKLKSLDRAIGELETQVDKLASNVQKTKQNLLDEAAIDNFIGIEAQLTDTDAAAFKSLTVKVDGFGVYEMQEASGLWMPSKTIPLYSGPMQPGAHRVEVEARLVMRHKDSMPLNSDVYRMVNKTFEISVPGGVANNRYVISIKPPEKLDGTAEATMKEAM